MYDPYLQPFEIRKVLNDQYTIPGNINGALLKTLELELKSARLTGNSREECKILTKIGDVYIASLLNSLAIRNFFDALKIAERIGDSLSIGLLNIKIGRTYSLTEFLIKTQYTEKGAAILQRHNKDPEIEAMVYYALGSVEQDPAKSDEYSKKALALQEKVMEKKPHDTTALANLSKYLNAVRRLPEALAIAKRIKDFRLTVFYLNNLGYDCLFQKKYAEALKYYQEALVLCKENKNKGLLKSTVYNLAEVYGYLHNWERAAHYSKLHSLVQESQYMEDYKLQYSEMQTIYETEKKDSLNSDLLASKHMLTEHLKLERQIELLLFVLIIVLIILSVFLFINRRKMSRIGSKLADQNREILEKNRILESLHDELAESETNLNIAQGIAHTANWVWDKNSDIYTFSAQFPQLFGVEEQDLLHDFRQTVESVVYPDDKMEFGVYFTESLKTGSFKDREYRILKEGKIHWIYSKYAVKTDSAGEIIHIAGTVQDISEMKERETEKIVMAEQQSFTKQLLASQEEERKRIAGELHDSLGQEMLAIKNMAQFGLTHGILDETAAMQLHKINEASVAVIESVRGIAFDLRPVHLERLGLTETIKNLLQKMQISATKFSGEIDDIDGLFSLDKELHIYRIIQESFSNILKHANAANARLIVQNEDIHVRVVIIDDGRGLCGNEKNNGFGLHGINSRLAILNGTINTKNADPKGYEQTIIIPVVKDGK